MADIYAFHAASRTILAAGGASKFLRRGRIQQCAILKEIDSRRSRVSFPVIGHHDDESRAFD